MEARRPFPVPDSVTQPFWDAAAEERLAIQRCQRCKRYYHPPVDICTTCIANGDEAVEDDLHFERVSGRGTIHSYTIVHDSRIEGFAQAGPYRVVVVELAEQAGVRLFANMPEAPEGAVTIGSPVECIFIDIGFGLKLPDFRFV